MEIDEVKEIKRWIDLQKELAESVGKVFMVNSRRRNGLILLKKVTKK
jgi:hypothetical protein